MIGCLLYILGLIITCLFLMFVGHMATILAVPCLFVIIGFWTIVGILTK